MTIKPKTILKQISIGVMVIDSSGDVQYVNPRAEKMFAHKICIGTSLKSIDHEFSKKLLACFKSDKVVNHTFHLNKQGKLGDRDLEILVSLALDGNGEKTANCFIQDLESVEAAAWMLPNIKKMKMQFQALVDHSYYGIYILDGQGIVLKVNDVAVDLIGRNKEEIVGMDIRELAKKGVIEKPLTPSILKTKKPLTRPLYVMKSNKYIMASGLPILDENGDILFVVVIEHDMTIVRELRQQLEQAKQVAKTIKDELSDRNLLELKNREIIADAPAMKQVLTVLLKLAKMDASNILITGESGTGKGFLSKFVHSNGMRKDQPFISINCAALPEMLLEAELFGYEKGAFTGASDSGKAGLFELANQGTIFLDEIGDLPFSVQAKLLKCLDDGEIRRLGGTEAIKVDCIVIAATNHDIEKLVQEKKFRQDLYFRLNIFPVRIPPLRERQEDVLKISKYYLKEYNQRYHQEKKFSEKCIEELQIYDFPGNVRELKNIIKNAVVIKENNVLNQIIPSGRHNLKTAENQAKQTEAPMSPMGFNQELLEFEREKLTQAVIHCSSTRDLAKYLGISQSTAARKLKKHGITMD